jgi:hypothetical protein
MRPLPAFLFTDLLVLNPLLRTPFFSVPSLLAGGRLIAWIFSLD